MIRFMNAVAENSSIQNLTYHDAFLHHDFNHWKALAHLMGKLPVSGRKRLCLHVRGEGQSLNGSERNPLASVFGARCPLDYCMLGIQGAVGVVIRDLLAVRSHYLIDCLEIRSSHDQVASDLARLIGSLPRLRTLRLLDFDVSKCEGLLSALCSSPC
jgi:hypothetical protein